MREILFRGKRTDNGEWVYGYYTKDKEQERSYIKRENIHPCGYMTIDYEVISETVGQYTGLTDKNGKKIFEGDILKNEKGTVFYGSYNCKVVLRSGMWFAVGFVEISSNDFELCEVIGNIHDNPELM